MTRLLVGLLILGSCVTATPPPRAIAPPPPAVDASVAYDTAFYNSYDRMQGHRFRTDVALGPLPASVYVLTDFREQGAYLASRASYLIRRDGQIVATIAADRDSRLDDARASVSLDQVGTYTAELLIDGKPLGVAPARLAVASLPCFGGERVLRARPVRPVSVSEAGISISRWRALDDVSPYVIEWRRDGALVKTEASYPENPSNLTEEVERFKRTFHDLTIDELRRARCAWDIVDEFYAMPSPAAANASDESIRVSPSGATDRTAKRGPPAPGSWSARIVVRDEEPIEISFTVDEAHKIVGTNVRLGTTSKEDVVKLQRAKKPSFKFNTGSMLAVTGAELRALTRSVEAVRLREKINELSMPATSNLNESAIHKRRDLSPEQKFRLIQKYNRELEQADAVETAKKRAQGRQEIKKLKKLIEQFGGPWTPDERPANHSSMLY